MTKHSRETNGKRSGKDRNTQKTNLTKTRQPKQTSRSKQWKRRWSSPMRSRFSTTKRRRLKRRSKRTNKNKKRPGKVHKRTKKKKQEEERREEKKGKGKEERGEKKKSKLKKPTTRSEFFTYPHHPVTENKFIASTNHNQIWKGRPFP